MSYLDPTRWELRQATKRWKKRNKEELAKGCPCGRPTEYTVEDNRNIGYVPVLWGRCAEHAHLGPNEFPSALVDINKETP